MQVAEHQMRMKDGRTGREEMTISRHIGNKVSSYGTSIDTATRHSCPDSNAYTTKVMQEQRVLQVCLCLYYVLHQYAECVNQYVVYCGLQGRTVTKQRQADGRQSQQQRLHNITEDDAGHFDEEWTYEAERSLPMYMRNNKAALPQASRTNRPPAVGW